MRDESFLETLALALEVDATRLHDGFTLAYANWDSLTVMSTIAAIDQHYDVAVSPPELYECSTVKDLFALVARKTGRS